MQMIDYKYQKYRKSNNRKYQLYQMFLSFILICCISHTASLLLFYRLMQALAVFPGAAAPFGTSTIWIPSRRFARPLVPLI